MKRRKLIEKPLAALVLFRAFTGDLVILEIQNHGFPSLLLTFKWESTS